MRRGARSGPRPSRPRHVIHASLFSVPDRHRAADCAQQLRRLFPALFDGPPRPLKLRIQADIQQRAPGTFARKALSAFFRRHTGSTGYLIAMVPRPWPASIWTAGPAARSATSTGRPPSTS